MTRRITLALLVTVVVTLLVSGAVTVAIARWQATATTEERTRDQAESLAALAAARPNAEAQEQVERVTRRVINELRHSLRVEGIEFVVIGEAGRLRGILPDGVLPDDLDVAALRAGTTLSGERDRLVWAAAPQPVNAATAVAVVTANAETDLTDVVPWFLAAAAVTLVVGAIVAWLLGRRLARPVRAAGDAAQRIAGGDLTTRLAPGRGSDELADLSQSINTMAEALEQARDRDRQFLLSISHDLRTPLTSIRGYADAITDGAAPDAAAAAAVIAAQAERLDRLVADLLLLARLDARAFPMHPVVVDLDEPVRAAARAFAPTAEAAGLRVEVRDNPGGAARVTVDPTRLEQALGNLLANAGRFATSRIDVSVVADGEDWIVRVDDDGPGIAPEQRRRVFEPLRSTRPTADADGAGVGLGLAIVHQLVLAMGGVVTASESSSGGARVELRLPATTPASTNSSASITLP